MTQSIGVSLTDIVRNVIRQAHEDEGGEPLASVLLWLNGDDKPVSPATWIGANVVDTAAFRTFLKTPDITIGGMLQQCKSATGAYAAATAHHNPSGTPLYGPNAADAQAVVDLLTRRWEGADLDTDDEDASSYKYARTVQAMKRAKDQLPMLVAVQQALSMFPEGIAGKLDAQAASVGDSVRKQAANNKQMKPGDIVGTVMQNPAFMEMMKTMMEQDDHAADTNAHEQQRALGARLRLIEMRLARLEAASGASGIAGGSNSKKKKKKGAGRASNTPTY